MVAAIRDSSLDYRTYWLQGGQFYSRRGLGEAAPSCSLPIDKLRQIPEADRAVLIEEVNADPAFCAKVARCMATNPNWGHVIAASAKEAIANEMNPSKFPHRAGMWPKLRARAQFLVEEVSRAMAQGKVPVAARPMSGLGDLGQWDIIASLVGTIGTAATSIYSAGVTSRAQIDAQRDQANAAIAAAQAQMNAINAANAMQAVTSPVASAVSRIASAEVAGIPLLALAIPAIGLIIYFATKK
jgi:hypothetical protein